MIHVQEKESGSVQPHSGIPNGLLVLVWCRDVRHLESWQTNSRLQLTWLIGYLQVDTGAL